MNAVAEKWIADAVASGALDANPVALLREAMQWAYFDASSVALRHDILAKGDGHISRLIEERLK